MLEGFDTGVGGRKVVCFCSLVEKINAIHVSACHDTTQADVVSQSVANGTFPCPSRKNFAQAAPWPSSCSLADQNLVF